LVWKKPEIYSLNIWRIIVTNVDPLSSLIFYQIHKKKVGRL